MVLTRGNLQDVATTVGRGELFALGCMLAWSAHVFMSRRIATVGLSALVATAWSVLAGAALLAVPLALGGNPQRVLHYPAGVWLSVLHMAWLATALAFIWFADGVRAVGPTRASVFTNFVPVVAVLVGVLALGDHLHWSMAVGGLLAVAGVWLANRQPAPAVVRAEAAERSSCHASVPCGLPHPPGLRRSGVPGPQRARRHAHDPLERAAEGRL
ncbi:DMT family transporter [Pseudoxanthomonas taiwanensis]|nr:DMT family transporter [Pseudoxanthomonas taiwanensis]